jgi:hypothetical protein
MESCQGAGSFIDALTVRCYRIRQPERLWLVFEARVRVRTLVAARRDHVKNS